MAQKLSAPLRASCRLDLLAVDVQPAAVAFLDGRRGKADCRNGEQLNSFQQRAKLIADDSPHPLSHDISRSRHQKRRKISVERLRAIVPRSGAQVMIVSRGVFYATRADLHRRDQIHVWNRDFFRFQAELFEHSERVLKSLPDFGGHHLFEVASQDSNFQSLHVFAEALGVLPDRLVGA